MRTAALSLIPLLLVPLHILADTPADLRARVEATAAATSLVSPGQKPWHARFTVQVHPGQPNAFEGTIERWWSAPQQVRTVYNFPDYKATIVQLPTGLFSTPGALAPNYIFNEFLRQVESPISPASEIDQSTPEMRKENFGKTQLECIMLTQPIRGHVGFLPLGLYPTFCTDPGKPDLRVSYEFGVQTTFRYKLGALRGLLVPLSLALYDGANSLVQAQALAINGQDAPYTETLDITGLTPINLAQIKVSGGVTAGNLLTKTQPQYPDYARQQHISGAVVLKAIIGTDGHVYALHPISSPDPSLSIASIAAVRQWTYKPYLVNGVPTETDTTITVNFSFGPG